MRQEGRSKRIAIFLMIPSLECVWKFWLITMIKENEKLEVRLNVELNRSTDLRGEVYEALDEINSVLDLYETFQKTPKLLSFKEYVCNSGEQEKFGYVGKTNHNINDPLTDAKVNVDCFPSRSNDPENSFAAILIASHVIDQSEVCKISSKRA